MTSLDVTPSTLAHCVQVCECLSVSIQTLKQLEHPDESLQALEEHNLRRAENHTFKGSKSEVTYLLNKAGAHEMPRSGLFSLYLLFKHIN